MLGGPLPRLITDAGMDANHRIGEEIGGRAGEGRHRRDITPRLRRRNPPHHSPLAFARDRNRLDELRQAIRHMDPLGAQHRVALPRQRKVEPRKQPVVFEASDDGRSGVTEHAARVGLKPEVDREIEAIGRQPLAQLQQFSLRDLQLSFARPRVKEVELDRAVERRLQFRQRERGLRAKHMQLRVRETLFQPPQRGHRRHEIADMVELGREDTPHAAPRDQRMAGVDRLGGFRFGRPSVRILREIAIEIRVALQHHGAPVGEKIGLVVDVGHLRAAREFVVNERRVRREHHELPRAARAQAVIDVVVHDAVGLVEPARHLIRRAAHHHACARHREHVPLAQREAERTRVVAIREAERVAAARRGEEHTGMLHLAVGVQQLRAYHAYLGPLGVADQNLHPFGMDHLDIVVEKQQIIAARRRRADIVEAGPVERLGDLDHPVGVFAQPGFPVEIFAGRNVVETDDLDVRPIRLLAQAADRGFDQPARRDRRNDD